jgi:hypothetical protein
VQTLDVIAQLRDVGLMSRKVSRIRLEPPVFGLEVRMFREERFVLSVEVALLRHLERIADGRVSLPT